MKMIWRGGDGKEFSVLPRRRYCAVRLASDDDSQWLAFEKGLSCHKGGEHVDRHKRLTFEKRLGFCNHVARP